MSVLQNARHKSHNLAVSQISRYPEITLDQSQVSGNSVRIRLTSDRPFDFSTPGGPLTATLGGPATPPVAPNLGPVAPRHIGHTVDR